VMLLTRMKSAAAKSRLEADLPKQLLRDRMKTAQESEGRSRDGKRDLASRLKGRSRTGRIGSLPELRTGNNEDLSGSAGNRAQHGAGNEN
jgi:hypothetical protein